MEPDWSVRAPFLTHSREVNSTEEPGSSGQHNGLLLSAWYQRSDNEKFSEFFALLNPAFLYW